MIILHMKLWTGWTVTNDYTQLFHMIVEFCPQLRQLFTNFQCPVKFNNGAAVLLVIACLVVVFENVVY